MELSANGSLVYLANGHIGQVKDRLEDNISVKVDIDFILENGIWPSL